MSNELDESEKYAILSNIPYLINSGVPIDTLQLELNDFGLDYKIDKELTDTESAVLTNNKEAVHSIRGTSLNVIDLIEDIKLGLTSQQLLTTIASKPHITAGLAKESSFLSMNYIPDSQLVMSYLKSIAPRGYKRSIPKTVNPEVRSMSKVNTPIQIVKSLYGLPFVVGGVSKLTTEATGKLFNAIYDSKSRHTIESNKHQKIIQKYPNLDKTLSSHSLGGSIANHISRNTGTKSISFNPAPSHLNKDKVVDKSIVYRTYFDPVSYIRADDELEKIIILPQKHYEPHSLTNFLPRRKLFDNTGDTATDSTTATTTATTTKPIKYITTATDTNVLLKRCADDPYLPYCKKSSYYV